MKDLEKSSFEAAFGKNIEEFRELLIMPDKYVIDREDHKDNGTAEWGGRFASLTSNQKNGFLRIVHKNRFDEEGET